jgi:hypothetical protein
MFYKHTFNCVQCKQFLTFKTNTLNYDAGKLRLPSLFHTEMEQFVRKHYKKNAIAPVLAGHPVRPYYCLGRLVHVSSVGHDVPDLAPVFAPHRATIAYGNLSGAGRAWVDAMMAGGNASCNVATNQLPAECRNNGPHNTDPRTGVARDGNVAVYEYYVNGYTGDGDRATARRGAGGIGLELFWSTTHVGNTYNYHLITQIP